MVENLAGVILADELAAFVTAGGTLKVTAFVDRHANVAVEFPVIDGLDPFFNINSQADLEMAGELARRPT